MLKQKFFNKQNKNYLQWCIITTQMQNFNLKRVLQYNYNNSSVKHVFKPFDSLEWLLKAWKALPARTHIFSFTRPLSTALCWRQLKSQRKPLCNCSKGTFTRLKTIPRVRCMIRCSVWWGIMCMSNHCCRIRQFICPSNVKCGTTDKSHSNDIKHTSANCHQKINNCCPSLVYFWFWPYKCLWGWRHLFYLNNLKLPTELCSTLRERFNSIFLFVQQLKE